MNFHLTESFQDKVRKLCKKDAQLRNAFKKQFSLFQNNEKHPSLKLHKLQGKRSKQYAIWIKGDLRALYTKESGQCVFFDLIDHDQY